MVGFVTIFDEKIRVVVGQQGFEPWISGSEGRRPIHSSQVTSWILLDLDYWPLRCCFHLWILLVSLYCLFLLKIA